MSDKNGHKNLADFALLYFGILVGEYDSLCEKPSRDQEADKLAADLKQAYENCPSAITWGDLCAFDRLLLRLRTAEEIRERIPAVESRYIEMARNSAYADFLLKSPMNLDTASDKVVRARADTIVSDLYRLLTVAACREKLRNRASARLIGCIWIFLGVFAFAGVVNAFFGLPPVSVSAAATSEGSSIQTAPPAQDAIERHKQAMGRLQQVFSRLSGTVVAVMLAGALGGFISAQRRVQGMAKRSTLMDLITLSQEGPMHSSAPVHGAVFALVLYMMLIGGLVTGPLFPTMYTFPEQETYVRFWDFFIASGPSSGLAWSKLLVWSFAAGFLERLVPDALTRLTKEPAEAKQ